ncbi:ATP-binding protein, KAP family [Thermaerobacter subterraneus DSM 13965]|uniref:ATP-binding protein, KAP family n=1 Tax=Thermaerobacter subterraneus DSM 13965 TaxID=867903 RepID=K6PQD7_9FIRM|nr:ATP-binding protein, KAP family [Thermaerobacter subterraneus DSM 13965]
MGGGHELTARALVDLVLNSSGGKAVALLGGWGSGKSTVVRLFQQAVERNSDKVRVFVFDAWSHEGDPLRRSFLERLAAFLAETGWVKGKALEQINNQMDELACRKESVYSQTSPVMTREGYWIGFFLTLGIPLGTALLSSQPIYQAPLWFSVLGVAALLSPFFVALYFMIRGLRAEGRFEFPSLVGQNRTETRTSTLRTPEPTSVEFEARFKDILDRAVTDDRRLVIVVDNLDRLPAEQARSVWATMRTFFDVRGAAWSEKIWLIVPFDPSAICHLWGNVQSDGENLTEVFISKFFQTRLHVPPPVLSDWKSFLFKRLREAFPRHHQEELYAVYRVYRNLVLRGDGQPAPRELKQFVNLVGSQHRIWQDAIPLPMQALYVALKEELAKNPRVALSKREAEVKKLFPEEEKWKDYLLAQHFNVEPNKALQVLFLEEIRKGLEAPGSPVLRETARQVRPEALGTLVLEALEEAGEWAEKAPELLAKAALAIKEVGGLLPEEDQRQALGLLRSRATSAGGWKMGDDEVVQGLMVLVASAPGAEERCRLIGVILRGAEAPSGNEVIKDAAKGLADFLDRVKRELDLGVPEDFRFPVQEPADWILVLSALDFWELEDEVQKAFTPRKPPEVLGELVARVGRGEFRMTEALATRALSYIDQGWDWKGLVNSLRGRLATGNRYTDEEVRAAIYALLQLEPISEEARNALRDLATSWFLLHHLAYANDGKTLGTLLLPLLIYNPTGQSQPLGGGASQGAQRYAGFLQNPKGVDLQGMAELLAELSESRETDFSVQSVIKAVKRNPQAKELVATLLDHLKEAYPEVFSPEILLEHGKDLSELLGEEAFEAMCRRRQDEIVEAAQSRGFALNLLPAYRRILRAAADGPAEAFIHFLGEGLKGLQKSDWSHLLKEGCGSDALARLRELRGRGFPVELDHRLADALEEGATALLEDEAAYDPTAIRAYLEFLTADARKNLSARMARSVSRLLVEYRDWGAEKFLGAVGEVVVEGAEEVGVEDLKHLLVTWLPNALTRFSQTELEWFAKLLEKRRALVTGLEKSIRVEALNRVQDAQTTVGDERPREALKGIASVLREEEAED